MVITTGVIEEIKTLDVELMPLKSKIEKDALLINTAFENLQKQLSNTDKSNVEEYNSIVAKIQSLQQNEYRTYLANKLKYDERLAERNELINGYEFLNKQAIDIRATGEDLAAFVDVSSRNHSEIASGLAYLYDAGLEIVQGVDV